ncbi:NPCBM/NEW2 domain-containing protein [Anatilimnocola floriformis]|uniref:NPCBM/NEW2 domain-containing protein n=1 Tax=Anatilimnocola floriformis TaxID=2948575 RepID=UPI0020C2BD2F|nr:NPCBM/NEW2 domain-containing protein [Anatilimnocola floriformis]
MIRATFLLALLMLPSLVRAQTSPAFPITGEPFSAELAGFDTQQNVKFKIGNKLRIMPAAELVRWGTFRDADTGPQIILASGGALRADVLSLDETHLVIGDASDLGSVLWGESSLPVEAVGGLVWQPPADSLARDRLLYRLLALPVGDDQVLLGGGEVLQGTLLSVPPAGRFAEKLTKQELAAAEVFTLQLPRVEKPLLIAASKVVAVRFGAAAIAKPAANQAFTRVGFRDGSWLNASRFEANRDSVLVHFPGGGKVAANNAFGDGSADWFWKQISLLQPISNSVVYVSDLQPIGYKHLPFLSGEWKYGVDQNVLGGQLRTPDQVFFKGLGMFPASRLAYALDGKFRRLQGQLAIDERAKLQGSVVFRVLLETASGWSTAYESPLIRGGDAKPIELSLDVKDAQRMAILVDFGDRGDACDYANWLDLRLLK